MLRNPFYNTEAVGSRLQTCGSAACQAPKSTSGQATRRNRPRAATLSLAKLNRYVRFYANGEPATLVFAAPWDAPNRAVERATHCG